MSVLTDLLRWYVSTVKRAGCVGGTFLVLATFFIPFCAFTAVTLPREQRTQRQVYSEPTLAIARNVQPTVKPSPLPTNTPIPEPTRSVGIPEEKRISGGIALTILAAQRTNQLSSYQKAKDNTQFVLVEVLIENIERDTTPYNPLYFKIKDSEGFEYSPEIVTSHEGSLKSGELIQGDKVRGIVAFETKKDATGMIVSYEPLVLFGGYEIIRVQIN